MLLATDRPSQIPDAVKSHSERPFRAGLISSFDAALVISNLRNVLMSLNFSERDLMLFR